MKRVKIYGSVTQTKKNIRNAHELSYGLTVTYRDAWTSVASAVEFYIRISFDQAEEVDEKHVKIFTEKSFKKPFWQCFSNSTTSDRLIGEKSTTLRRMI